MDRAAPDGEPEEGTERAGKAEGQADPEPEPLAEPEPPSQADGEPVAWDAFRTDMAAVASVQDRESRRTSTAVTRFRGPTSARITIIQ
ncbi:MAG: hypothetical protein A6D92_10380 [Symbiobacterium thermophilum]|uniref:Uncharacterized protein n=1 Tax=Symbiobacterium thermophilum TaxID=2734 RepID=A0A1Y2T3W2_SYMTR|nr:MAG: hypothetical protein A6D92_10380 [Symbiobacterium thermophilum]